MSLPDKPRGQWDTPTHEPTYAEGMTPAPNTPVTEVWKGPTSRDWTDELRDKKEAERLAAANQPAAPAPPPRPVPTTLADALAVVSRFTGELPGEPDIAAARGYLKTRLAEALPKPCSRAIVGGKNLGPISDEAEGLAVYLVAELAGERARVSRLEASLRDLAEGVAVLVKVVGGTA